MTDRFAARVEPARLLRQLDAIDSWHAARRRRLGELAAAPGAAVSREARVDAARALEVLERVHAAVVDRAGASLRGEDEPERRTAVLAHPKPWTAARLAAMLEQQGFHVLAQEGNGADVVGTVIVDQPDLLVVNDALTMLPGPQVIEEVRRFAPRTAVVAMAGGPTGVGAALDAGAQAVCRQADLELVVRCAVEAVSGAVLVTT